jgi:cell wall-associated NlpC family hydrolase
MQLPSVSSMFEARLGAVRSRIPGFMQGFANDYASALQAEQSQASGDARELTIEPGEPAQQTEQTVQAEQPASTQRILYMSGSRASRILPLYIPASSAGAAYAQSATTSSLARKVVDFAKQYVGIPYVHGGESLVTGADCSGFTQAVYKHFGIKLPRSANNQSKVGELVSPEDLQPGDLMFFKTADYAPVTHVAIYIGDGKVVQASSVKTGVIISKLCKNWATNSDFVIARRVLPQ